MLVFHLHGIVACDENLRLFFELVLFPWIVFILHLVKQAVIPVDKNILLSHIEPLQSAQT